MLCLSVGLGQCFWLVSGCTCREQGPCTLQGAKECNYWIFNWAEQWHCCRNRPAFIRVVHICSELAYIQRWLIYDLVFVFPTSHDQILPFALYLHLETMMPLDVNTSAYSHGKYYLLLIFQFAIKYDVWLRGGETQRERSNGGEEKVGLRTCSENGREQISGTSSDLKHPFFRRWLERSLAVETCSHSCLCLHRQYHLKKPWN